MPTIQKPECLIALNVNYERTDDQWSPLILPFYIILIFALTQNFQPEKTAMTKNEGLELLLG